MDTYYQGGLSEALDKCAEDPDNVPVLSRLADLVADGLLYRSNGCVVDGEDVGVLHAVVTALCYSIRLGAAATPAVPSPTSPEAQRPPARRRKRPEAASPSTSPTVTRDPVVVDLMGALKRSLGQGGPTPRKAGA